MCEFEREADRASKDCVNRTRLLRLYEEGACDDEEVRWAKRITSHKDMMNDQNFIGDGKSGDILRGSGANVARCSLGSLGGVLSPPTSASSAFRFPLDCCPITGGVIGLCKTEVVGIVGWDL